MFDPSQSDRLLRTDWRDADELARELVDMIRSPEPKKINAPLEIQAPAGQVGLKLTRTPAKPAATTSVTTVNYGKAANPYAVPGAVPHSPTPVSISAAPKIAPDSTRPPASRTDLSSITGHESIPAGGFDVPARRQSQPLDLPPNNASFRVQSRPGDDNSTGDPLAGTTPNFARAYVNPIFETNDAVRFGGAAPVQFDSEPYVLNRDTDQYEPISRLRDRTTPQPSFSDSDFWWGEVTSGGPGLVYQCNIYPYPGADLDSSQPVTVWKMNPAATLPPGTPLFPIHLADDGNYYAQPPVWLGGFGG